MSRFKSYRMTPQRQTLIDETKAALDQILANEDDWGLTSVEEMTEWVSNCKSHTCGDIVNVIGALLPIMSMTDLRDVHRVAAFHVKNPTASRRQERAA